MLLSGPTSRATTLPRWSPRDSTAKMHPWHDIYVDDALIATAFPVVIEIPKGSKNKYELDKETGLLRLDRVLYSAVHYPGQLRLHPAQLLRRRRSAGRAGAGAGAGVSADASSRRAPSA